MDIHELNALGFNSEDDAKDAEWALGIRFSDFTPEDHRTWRLQELCLKQYALTPDYEQAARRAGVTVGDVEAWERFNVLGFVKRKEVADLEFSDRIKMVLLEMAKKPDSPPLLLSVAPPHAHARKVRCAHPGGYGRRPSRPNRSGNSPTGGRGVSSHRAGTGTPPRRRGATRQVRNRRLDFCGDPAVGAGVILAPGRLRQLQEQLAGNVEQAHGDQGDFCITPDTSREIPSPLMGEG